MTEAAGHGVVLLVNDNPFQLNAAQLFLSSEGLSYGLPKAANLL